MLNIITYINEIICKKFQYDTKIYIIIVTKSIFVLKKTKSHSHKRKGEKNLFITFLFKLNELK